MSDDIHWADVRAAEMRAERAEAALREARGVLDTLRSTGEVIPKWRAVCGKAIAEIDKVLK